VTLEAIASAARPPVRKRVWTFMGRALWFVRDLTVVGVGALRRYQENVATIWKLWFKPESTGTV
jgi:hypothetical protein